MTRRAVLADTGPMDERFFLAGGDVAWSCEMKRHGWQVYYVADARIIHRESASRRRVPRAAHLDWILAHRRLLYRYRGFAQGLAGDAVFACHFLLLAAAYARGVSRRLAVRSRSRLRGWTRASRRGV
jgi:GT2 family glycosyltransferase